MQDNDRIPFFFTTPGMKCITIACLIGSLIWLVNCIVYTVLAGSLYDRVFAIVAVICMIFYALMARRSWPAPRDYAIENLFKAYRDYRHTPNDERYENLVLKAAVYDTIKQLENQR